MFKNPTSKFQMFKGTDRSEGARGAALAAARLPVTGWSDIASAVFRADEAVARARIGGPAASREPAFLDTATCFAKVSGPKLSLRELSAPERRRIPRGFAFLNTTTSLPKFRPELFMAAIFSA
jgi:hypothetical protein